MPPVGDCFGNTQAMINAWSAFRSPAAERKSPLVHGIRPPSSGTLASYFGLLRTEAHSLSVPPIIRFSVNIHYGGDDHFLSDNGVNQGVGELFNKAAMKCVVQRGPSLWKFQDALYRGLNLFRESQSETRLLKFVVFDPSKNSSFAA